MSPQAMLTTCHLVHLLLPMTPKVSCFSYSVPWCDLQSSLRLFPLLPGMGKQWSQSMPRHSLGRVICANTWILPSNRQKILKQNIPKPAELHLAMASLLLKPQLANLRPSLVTFATLQLLLYLQGKELKELKWLGEINVCVWNKIFDLIKSFDSLWTS